MPLTIETEPLLTAVKERSKLLHRDVEAILLRRLAAIKQKQDYAAILRLFYGYYFPVEQRIAQHVSPALLPDIAERRKAAAIVNDLKALGCDTMPLPLCQRLPAIDNTAQAMGALYVLEGSTLGGKIIANLLLKNKALCVTKEALTFFSGYGDETGCKWKSFLHVFSLQRETDAVIATVNETFLHLKRFLQQSFSHDGH